MFEDLYNLGFSLVPYNGADKYPRGVDGWQRYCYNRASLGQLREWLKTNDRFGICCGPASNLVVFDTDTERGEKWARENLPRTPWVVRTGRKENGFRGFHRYYRWPNGAEFGNGLPEVLKPYSEDVDLRGAGGQVVAPGVTHSSGVKYEALNWPWSTTDGVPEWPRELIPPKEVTTRIDVSNRAPVNLEAYEKAQRFLDKQHPPREGDRNNTIYSVACGCLNLGCSVSETERLMIEWNRTFPSPVPEKEVFDTVNSASNTATEPISNKPEWTPPRNGKSPGIEADRGPAQISHDCLTNIPQDDRQRIEWEYIVTAWQDEKSLPVLTAYNLDRWKDPTAKICAETLRELNENEGEFDLATVADSMRTKGHLEAYRALESFYEANRHKLKQGSLGAAKAFQKATRWDDYQRVVFDAAEQLGKGDPDQAITVLKDAVDEVLARQMGVKYKTLRDIVRERLQKIADGEEDGERVWIELLSELMGEASGGDVVPICGPPKTGKSFLLRTARAGFNKAGIPSLTSQYELSEAQIAEREIRAHTCSFDELTPEEAKKLLEDDPFELEENAIVTLDATSIETCRAEVWPILAANPQIRAWLLDYNERIYELTKGGNQYLEAQRVAKFVKDTAKKFGVVALVLLQPNNKYYDYGAAGPSVNYIDFGNRWVKDSYALWFMHKPARFKENVGAPPDLVEFHLLASRGSEDGTICYTQFLPVESRFRKHPDAVSLSAQRDTPSIPQTFGKTANGKAVEYVDISEVEFEFT